MNTLQRYLLKDIDLNNNQEEGFAELIVEKCLKVGKHRIFDPFYLRKLVFEEPRSQPEDQLFFLQKSAWWLVKKGFLTSISYLGDNEISETELFACIKDGNIIDPEDDVRVNLSEVQTDFIYNPETAKEAWINEEESAETAKSLARQLKELENEFLISSEENANELCKAGIKEAKEFHNLASIYIKNFTDFVLQKQEKQS
jgi:hypothetical protein